MFQVDVVREDVRLFSRKRVIIATAQFATHSEAYWWARPYSFQGYAVELMNLGYISHHPIELDNEDQHLISAYRQVIEDYFGDEVDDSNWEAYADEMERTEAQKRYQSHDDVPF